MSADRYLILAMLRGGIPILGLLLGLFAFLTLAEELEDVGKGTFAMIDAMRVVALSLPKITLELLPVTSLAGVLVGLGALASQQELIALRAAGWSNFRIARPVALLATFIICATAASQQWLIPALERQIADLRGKADTDSGQQGDTFWTRSGSKMILIGGVRFGLMPTDIEIHELDDAGHVERLLQARSADILSEERWQLYNVLISEIDAAEVSRTFENTYQWRSVLSLEQMAAVITALDALPPVTLLNYVRHLEENDLDSHRFRLVLWQQISLPVAILGMALLGVPFVVGSVRSMSVGSRVSIGVVIGLTFYLLERTISQVSLLYVLPVIPLALGPDLFILAVALAALSRAR